LVAAIAFNHTAAIVWSFIMSQDSGKKEKSYGQRAAEAAGLALVGTIAVGTVGAIIGGPPGAVIGAKIGALLGGGGAGASGAKIS